MSKVLLIIPIFSRDLEEEKKRYQKAWGWFWDNSKTDAQLKKFKLVKNDFDLQIQGQRTPPMKDGNLKITAEGLVGKGTIVSHALQSTDYNMDKYVILVDGDDQISLDKTFEIIKELNKGEEAVLSCRANMFGIDEKRKNVELFENFILSERFQILLPDSQCGCWGFRYSLIQQKRVGIHCKGFEIELDLISSLLMADVIPIFKFVNVAESAKTDFREEDHVIKMNFLCNKLKIDSFHLNHLLKKFETKNKIQLPKKYKKKILSAVPNDFQKKVVKCDGCSKRKNNPNCFVRKRHFWRVLLFK